MDICSYESCKVLISLDSKHLDDEIILYVRFYLTAVSIFLLNVCCDCKNSKVSVDRYIRCFSFFSHQVTPGWKM